MDRGAPWARLFCSESSMLSGRLVSAPPVARHSERESPMQARCVSVLGRVVAAVAMTALVAGAVAIPSYAQQPTPKTQPKGQPKSPPAPAPAQQPQQGGEPQLVYSAWTKVCQKGPEANAKRVCFIGRDGRMESGMPVVAAGLIEPHRQPTKLLRGTPPLGMALQAGAPAVIDQRQPINHPYVVRLPH